MRGVDRLGRSLRLAVELAAVGALSACASNSALPGFLPSPEMAGAETYGGWIEVELDTAVSVPLQLAGELLAVTQDSIWLATSVNQGYVVARRAIAKGKVTWYDAQRGGLALATVGGTLSTVSNGAFLLLTAPAWILTGTIGAAAYSNAPQLGLEPDSGERQLRAFARYPLGMPPGRDASFTRVGVSGEARPGKSPPL
jgi:hypothetical protein